MKLTTIAVLSSTLALVAAHPLEEFKHKHKRHRVVKTVVEEVVETVRAYTTVWVKAGEQPAPASTSTSPSEADNNYSYTYSFDDQLKSTSTSTTPSATVVPPAPSTSSTPPTVVVESEPVASSTPAQISTTSAPVVKEPEPTIVPETTPPPVQQTTPLPVPQTTTQPPPVETSSVEAPAVTSSPSSGSGSGSGSGGACGELGGDCSGDFTVYDITAADIGACGFLNHDGTLENIVALPWELMGTQSNGNPFCGRKIQVELNGKTATGTVMDKCMGCSGQSIDCSHHLYDELGVESVGRYHDVKWRFVS